MKIAVLGLGRMGHAVAHRLLDGGHELTVWNRSPGKADELVAAGATEARTAADAVSAVEVALSSLANDDAVRGLALGEGGIRQAVGSRTYGDMSTISPSLSAELGRSFERFVALPIVGAPQAVREGRATYLAGGPAETVDGLGPVLETLGGNVKRYARPELASTAKLSVNLMLLAGIASLAESFTVGRAGGLGDEELVDLLYDSPVVAPGLKNRFRALLAGSGPMWWTTALAAKDARLAIGAAGRKAQRLRVATAVRDVFEAAVLAGHEDEDIIAIAHLYE